MEHRSLLKEVDEHYDVLVVGGGITGAGIFRDLALHGVKSLLIDKVDFASQTSHKSSRMFHGGVRYLESMNFGLVWEALHEKNLWLKVAPHLCKELPFHMPVFKESKNPLWMIRIGLTLYDALSGFQNSNSSSRSKSKSIEEIPHIKSDNLRGSGVYYDAIIDDSKVTLENIYDGLEESDQKALNYVEMIDFKHGDEWCSVTLRDTLTGETKVVKAQDVVFATGPFTDQLLEKIPEIPWSPKLIPSKGSHIWLPHDKLPLNNPLVLMTSDGRLVFVIPQKDMVLCGTTEKVVSGNLFNLKASEEEIDYLIKNLNEFFPTAEIEKGDILSSYAGVRPLVKANENSDAGKTARNHKIFWPYENVSVIVGGKLTTFRVMGQKITKKIVKKHHGKYNKNLTKTPLRHHSVIDSFSVVEKIKKEEILKILREESVRTFDDLVDRRMSIPSRSQWKANVDFDKFFTDLLPEMRKYIVVTEEDILNFK